MSLMAVAALCAAAAAGGNPAPTGTDCKAVAREYQAAVARAAPLLLTSESRDAIARVAYAEAGNQGDSGLAGVVYAIMNRLIDGGFGAGVPAVLNARGQFEPVGRVGGWDRLPARSAVEQAHIDTILNLALDGRLPDPTNGARYFQNPRIVADRAGSGTVSPAVVNFGGQKPVAVIKDHAFYDAGTSGTGAAPVPHSLILAPDTPSGGASPEQRQPASQPTSLFVPLSH